MANVIVSFISILSYVLVIAIIVRALLSWFMPAGGTGLSRVLVDVTEPVLAPIRRLLPSVGGIDFSPILAILLVQLVSRVLIALVPAS
ncbi:MAG TPA: YggT family protein [Chloroflexota bacterium]|nr:YggT family protein [Chloroflexota bacterium]